MVRRRFECMDVVAKAAVERSLVPSQYTTHEGGSWFDAPIPSWKMNPHSIRFSNGEEWDEYNGWRRHG